MLDEAVEIGVQGPQKALKDPASPLGSSLAKRWNYRDLREARENRKVRSQDKRLTKTRKPIMSPAERAEADRLLRLLYVDEGFSACECAVALGISKQGVLYRLKRLSINRRFASKNRRRDPATGRYYGPGLYTWRPNPRTA